MCDATRDHLRALFANARPYLHQAAITLTAIHPTEKRRTPSRHILLGNRTAMYDAVERLLRANAQGWGAYVAVGLRSPGLTRYRRGGVADLVALPALFADLDDASPDALARLQAIQPVPSCITFTGGGFHAYWWLSEPLTDMGLARRLLRGLQTTSGGDALSPAQSLRLVGSHNTKPGRDNALCRVVQMNEQRYTPDDFTHLLPKPRSPPNRHRSEHKPSLASGKLNPALVQAVAQRLAGMGYVQRGDWLCGPCLHPQRHAHADQHPSFGFNVRSGYGNCYVCGSILLKDICDTLNIHTAAYGSIFV